jgi:hypothetical protein
VELKVRCFHGRRNRLDNHLHFFFQNDSLVVIEVEICLEIVAIMP